MTTLTEAPAVAPKPKQRQLTALDRCDKCNGSAYFRTTFESGSQLLWCNHHFNKNKAAMEEQGILVYTLDESEWLLDNRLVGSEN